jgi:hypothetical protein
MIVAGTVATLGVEGELEGQAAMGRLVAAAALGLAGDAVQGHALPGGLQDAVVTGVLGHHEAVPHRGAGVARLGVALDRADVLDRGGHLPELRPVEIGRGPGGDRRRVLVQRRLLEPRVRVEAHRQRQEQQEEAHEHEHESHPTTHGGLLRQRGFLAEAYTKICAGN